MVQMSIEKLLDSLVNRVIIYFVIEAFIQVIVAMSGTSGWAGAVVGAVSISAFVVIEVLNWVGLVTARG